MIPTRNHEAAGSIPGLTQWVEDLPFLQLWHRPVATDMIRPLAWDLPYAVGVALEKDKKTEKKKDEEKSQTDNLTHHLNQLEKEE